MVFIKDKILKFTAICAAAALLATGIFAAGAFAEQENDTEEATGSDIVVGTISPEMGSIIVSSEYIGVLEPVLQVMVHPKVSGEVLAVHFNVGDYVEEGDLLFEVDSTTMEFTINQTQAAVASAQARANHGLAVARENLSNFDIHLEDGHDATLRGATNGIDAAEAALNQAINRLQSANVSATAARRQLREYRNDGVLPMNFALWPDAVADMYEDQIGDQLRDAARQAQLAADAARLGVEQAELNLQKARDGYVTAEVMVEVQRNNIENQVEQARLSTNLRDQYINIERLKNDLEYFSVTAPISGVVERRNVDQFSIATPQAPAFVISDKNAMTVSFKISRDVYPHVNAGDRVSVENGDSLRIGTITEISTMVDHSGLFTVKANIPNPPDGFYTGGSVKVFAESQKAENTVLVPLSAIYYDNGSPFVYIAENGLAKRVDVVTGIFDHRNIQIISGVTINDQIISTWSARLSDGAELVISE
jgi:RND family efflux transporter MFP subunit